jgi:hypothetical protein
VEEPDLWQLDGEVAEEDEDGAVPLLFPRGDFLLWRVLLAMGISGVFWGSELKGGPAVGGDLGTHVLEFILV